MEDGTAEETAPEEVAVESDSQEEDPEVGEEPSEDVADDEEPSAEEEVEEGEQSEEVETLAQLAEAMGVPVQELSDNLKIDEDGEMVSLSDVISTYRANPKAAEAVSDAERSKSEYESRTGELREEHDNRLKETAQLTQALIDQITSDDQNIDWKSLEENDPHEYMRLRLRRDDRIAAVDKSIASFHSEQESRSKAFAQQREEYRVAERSKLLEWKPEWKDTEVAVGAIAKIQTYLSGLGFESEQIQGIDDSKMIKVIWSAMQYDSAQKSASKKLRSARKLPKVPTLKGAARVERLVTDQKSNSLDKTFARLQQHGEVEDAAKLIEGFLEE